MCIVSATLHAGESWNILNLTGSLWQENNLPNSVFVLNVLGPSASKRIYQRIYSEVSLQAKGVYKIHCSVLRVISLKVLWKCYQKRSLTFTCNFLVCVYVNRKLSCWSHSCQLSEIVWNTATPTWGVML